MKSSLTALIVAFFVCGCASQGQSDQYVRYGQVGGDRVRIPACNPFRADELMAWATELDGRVYHRRDAYVVVDAQGWVRCRSKEAAGSRSR